MSVHQPIFPAYGSGQLITTGAGAGAAALSAPPSCKQLVLTARTQDCYVRLTRGDDTSNASTADFLVPVGTPRTISKSHEQTRISYIAPGGAGTLHAIGADGSTAM